MDHYRISDDACFCLCMFKLCPFGSLMQASGSTKLNKISNRIQYVYDMHLIKYFASIIIKSQTHILYVANG